MFKKVLLGIIAFSALALLWTEANAQDCLRWRNVGGSQVCARWSTGSVFLTATCPAGGENCTAFADIFTDNSIVFCQLPGGAIRKASCTDPVSFGGQIDQ